MSRQHARQAARVAARHWPVIPATITFAGLLLSPRWQWLAGLAATSLTTCAWEAICQPRPAHGRHSTCPYPTCRRGFIDWTTECDLLLLDRRTWPTDAMERLIRDLRDHP
jgi:hypothetical protein